MVNIGFIAGYWTIFSGTQPVLACVSLRSAVRQMRGLERERRRVCKPVSVERRADKSGVPMRRRARDLRPVAPSATQGA